MDPVSLALAFMMKNPAAVSSAAEKALAPGAVDVSKMQGSLADLSRGVLTCYHKTARFGSVDYLGSPWRRHPQYGADKSMVIRIRYAGLGSVNQYEMVVAVMAKEDNRVRTAVITDTAMVPYSKRCALEEWTGA